MICPDCGGDGRETCNSPDHGFIHSIQLIDNPQVSQIGRLGCPVCGYDPNYKVINGGSCERCEGAGFIEGGSCEKCGCDLEPEDDRLCDQCDWWESQS